MSTPDALLRSVINNRAAELADQFFAEHPLITQLGYTPKPLTWWLRSEVRRRLNRAALVLERLRNINNDAYYDEDEYW